jgi:hypothetical protein
MSENDDEEIVWPWGMTERDPDPASRPWVFRPRGFLVAVLEDDDAADSATLSLREAGFPERRLRSFTGNQVLEDRERFLASQRSVRRLVERVTSDTDAVQRFVDYAQAGRAFLWVYVPDRKDANRAIRALSEHEVLHFRYFGDDSIEDLHVG